jgi:hypothetical protein
VNETVLFEVIDAFGFDDTNLQQPSTLDDPENKY